MKHNKANNGSNHQNKSLTITTDKSCCKKTVRSKYNNYGYNGDGKEI